MERITLLEANQPQKLQDSINEIADFVEESQGNLNNSLADLTSSIAMETQARINADTLVTEDLMTHEESETAHQNIQDALNDKIAVVTGVADKSVKMPDFNASTFALTFMTNDGETKVIDLPLENLAKDLNFDVSTNELVLTKQDGSVLRLPLSGLIDVYTGETSAEIQVTINTGNKIRATILNGSIDEAKLTLALKNLINNTASGLTALTGEVGNKVDKTEFNQKIQEVNESLSAKQPLLTAGDNISIVDNVISANGGGSGGVSTFDVVIRTQAEFEELYNSADWLGAKSVAFVGDGGTLEFTRSTTGLKIPQTVKQIEGFNSAKIKITDFVYNATTNLAGMWYATIPTTTDYWVRGIEINNRRTDTASAVCHGFFNCTYLTNCTAIAGGPYGGNSFFNCTYLTNCTGAVSGNAAGATATLFRGCTHLINCTGTCYGYDYSYPFFNCTYLTNCICNPDGTSIVYAFFNCTQLTNCIGTHKGQGRTVRAFFNCTQLTNCIGDAGSSSSSSGSTTYAFENCKQLTNCTATGSGGTHASTTGYGFVSCSFTNGCKAGTTASKTALWGGTNTFRDDDSCQLE